MVPGTTRKLISARTYNVKLHIKMELNITCWFSVVHRRKIDNPDKNPESKGDKQQINSCTLKLKSNSKCTEH